MPLRGLVHDSPIITAIQKTTHRGQTDVMRNEQAVRKLEETEAILYAFHKLFVRIARMLNIFLSKIK